VIETTNLDDGLSGAPISSVVVSGGRLVITASDGVFTLDNVAAVPEPETYALMLAGIGLIGAIARRKSAVRTKTAP
jgi:hypothetical protein